MIAGLDPADLPDPAAALAALEAASFIVSLELRVSAVTDRADVVLPGGRCHREARHVRELGGPPGSFHAALAVPAQPDLRVLASLADEMDVHLGLPDAAAARRELTELAGPAAAGTGRPVGAPGSAPALAQPRPAGRPD